MPRFLTWLHLRVTDRRRLAFLLATCVLLAGVVAGLNVTISYMDEYEPFRRVGPPDPTATLEQTLDWLKKAIQGTEVTYALDNASSPVTESYDELSYDGCNVAVKVVDASFATYRVSFNLLDLSEIGRPIKMAYGGQTHWKVPLQTADSRAAIQERFGPASYTSFGVSTPEMAQRVANGFNHAIHLCRKRLGKAGVNAGSQR